MAMSTSSKIGLGIALAGAGAYGFYRYVWPKIRPEDTESIPVTEAITVDALKYFHTDDPKPAYTTLMQAWYPSVTITGIERSTGNITYSVPRDEYNQVEAAYNLNIESFAASSEPAAKSFIGTKYPDAQSITVIFNGVNPQGENVYMAAFRTSK